MFDFFGWLFGKEDNEIIELFPASKPEADGTVTESEIPDTRGVADTSQAAFTPQVLNPLDWESQPSEEATPVDA
jgi:hypothetical protein